MRKVLISCLFIVFPLMAAEVSGQETDAEPTWTGTASAGLAFTSGNKDTSTLNAGYEFVYEGSATNTIKSDGLYIRGATDGELSADRLALNVRDQYRFNDGFFVFGQGRYLRDRFKEIDYLTAPTVGLGYEVIDTDLTSLTLDAGVGGVWEKNRGRDVRSSGAITLDEKLSHQLTDTTTITQSVAALWKTQDFGDRLLTFGASIAVSVTSQTQLKVEWVDTYKSKPPAANIQQNDTSVLVALVFST